MTRSELKHLAIIKAAKQAFNEYGVQNTSMDKIAQLAQVSKRTVYNHFENKETLVMTLVKQLWRSALVDIDIKFDTQTDLSTQLNSIIAQEIGVIGAGDYIDLSRAAFGHLLYQPHLMKQEINALKADKTCLFSWLEQAAQNNALHIDDIQFAHDQIHNLIKGSCFWPQLMQLNEPLSPSDQQTLCEQTVSMFLSRYANQ